MNNMRSFSIAFYPETKQKMEVIKNENGFTWDELFNYLMELTNEEKSSETEEAKIS